MYEEILSKVDHTLLKQTATMEEIKAICDEAIAYRTASVCIPPSFVARAKEYVQDSMKICTVIGFPNGYSTTKVKVFETQDALQNGADEIDMDNKILKVIIETCLLTTEEKIKMCEIVTESGADFIKTSTGFSTAGATFEDIELFSKYVGENVRIKAAGGIHSLEDAKHFIELGAERLGTSRIITLVKKEEGKG